MNRKISSIRKRLEELEKSFADDSVKGLTATEKEKLLNTLVQCYEQRKEISKVVNRTKKALGITL